MFRRRKRFRLNSISFACFISKKMKAFGDLELGGDWKPWTCGVFTTFLLQVQRQANAYLYKWGLFVSDGSLKFKTLDVAC